MTLNPRMTAIYETKGRAKEYAELAVNIYMGCAHACEYCYAPVAMHKKRDEFFEIPRLRHYVIDKLEGDLQKMKNVSDNREVLMCFACDPYQPLDEKCQATRKAIEAFIRCGRHFTVLTKGGIRSIRDFDLLADNPDLCRYGATLVFSSDKDSLKYEPGASPTSERIGALAMAKVLGIRTWVSLEPVWTAEDAMSLISTTCGFVDEYRIGPLNYHPQKKNVDWRQFKKDIVNFCEDLGVNYKLKKDLEALV